VPWQEAGDHVGRLVTIEGHVVLAETRDRTCVLDFDPDDDRGVTVLLLIPLVTNLPPAPHRLYEGRRVQATGRIHRFGGRLEMVVQSPDQIEVLGLTDAAVPAEPAAPDPPAGAAPAAPSARTVPAATSAPVAAPVVEPSAPDMPPAEPTVVPATLPSPAELACRRARENWRQARDDARRAARELTVCLDGEHRRCAPLGDRLGPILTQLEWAEQRLEATCPPGTAR
jgi:hypothetical protein